VRRGLSLVAFRMVYHLSCLSRGAVKTHDIDPERKTRVVKNVTGQGRPEGN